MPVRNRSLWFTFWAFLALVIAVPSQMDVAGESTPAQASSKFVDEEEDGDEAEDD